VPLPEQAGAAAAEAAVAELGDTLGAPVAAGAGLPANGAGPE